VAFNFKLKPISKKASSIHV